MSNYESDGRASDQPNNSDWDDIGKIEYHPKIALEAGDDNAEAEVAQYVEDNEDSPDVIKSVFYSFMEAKAPEDVDPIEYANSPQGYTDFVDYVSRLDDKSDSEQVDIVFRYSADFLDRGGRLSSELDDFIFDKENEDVLEQYADTVQRMRAQRLEMIPQEVEGRIEDYQKCFQEINAEGVSANSGDLWTRAYGLLSYLRTFDIVAKNSGGALDIALVYASVREKVIPELLPEHDEYRDSSGSFDMLTQFATKHPDIIDGINVPAVEAAKYVSAHNRERHSYDSEMKLIIGTYVYDKENEGKRVIGDDGNYSDQFRKDIYYGISPYCYVDDSGDDNGYKRCMRDAYAEIIGPERQKAVELAAQYAGDSAFASRFPILADAIVSTDNLEDAEDKLRRLSELGDDVKASPTLVIIAMRDMEANADRTADQALSHARLLLKNSSALMEHVGCDENSLAKMDDIITIYDNYPFNDRSDYFGSKIGEYLGRFKERIRSDQRLTQDEVQVLGENMGRIKDLGNNVGIHSGLVSTIRDSLWNRPPFYHYSEDEKNNYKHNIHAISDIRPVGTISQSNVEHLQEALAGKWLLEGDLDSPSARANLRCAMENCDGLDNEKVIDIILKFIAEDEHFTSKDISPESIEGIASIVRRIQNSNSLELHRLVEPLTRELIDSSDKKETDTEISYDIAGADERLGRIEKIFLQNDLPTFAKNVLVFSILHPVDQFRQQFINGRERVVSPMLTQASERVASGAYSIILRDLVRNSIESNSLDLRKYLEELQLGQSIMDRIGDGETTFDDLEPDEQTQVRTFVNYLVAGYNQTRNGYEEEVSGTADAEAQDTTHNWANILTGDTPLYRDMPITPDTIAQINKVMGVTEEQSAADKLACRFTALNGFERVSDILSYMDTVRDKTDARNRAVAEPGRPFVIHPGDLVKNANGKYLDDMLKNGVNCKEFLGASADSDQTPLDSDFTLVETEADIGACREIQDNPNGNYGRVWFVLRNNNERFVTTRKKEGQPGGEVEEPDWRDRRMELFYTGAVGDSHYGVRTGISSADIDAIVIDTENEFVDKTAFRIVKNGFYIPVYDLDGKIVFTPTDYNNLRAKLSGNHEYRTGEYNKASEADFATDAERTRDIYLDIEENNRDTARKDVAIRVAFAKKLEAAGLQLRDHIDDDLTPGFVEISSTGSTGRGTNVPHDGDFDYILRIDRSILADKDAFSRLSEQLSSVIKMDEKSKRRPGFREEDFRTKHVHVDGLEDEVDIDVTFVPRTDKVTYATEDSIKDYLSNFTLEERTQVVKNIIFAKMLFKDRRNKCYKPKHAGKEDGVEIAEGGLGGVGVENWILQNGGSLTAAARSFLEKAGVLDKPADATPIPLVEFVKEYPLWDLGANHMAEEKEKYQHDNFTASNLDEDGYAKIVGVLRGLLGR